MTNFFSHVRFYVNAFRFDQYRRICAFELLASTNSWRSLSGGVLLPRSLTYGKYEASRGTRQQQIEASGGGKESVTKPISAV